MSRSKRVKAMVLIAALLAIAGIAPASGAPGGSESAVAARARHWTAARRAAAIPRDMVMDEQGRRYLRGASGRLEPYGHSTPAPRDAAGPAITTTDPANGAALTSAPATLKATVTDVDGVKSVTFTLAKTGATSQTYSATQGTNNVWSAPVSLADGAWSWTITATDRVKRKGGNVSTKAVTFTVNSGGSGGGGGTPTVVADADWPTTNTDVQKAVGRIYFQMPDRRGNLVGYVCSGTVATESTAGRSVVITAAHCVYDDVYKVFAQNELFIPNQDATTGTGTDQACENDPVGCWAPSAGVVDTRWTQIAWPDNIPYDYAYYVVPDGSHRGAGGGGALDAPANAGSLPVSFNAPTAGTHTYGIGYSYDQDPNLRYCAEGLAVENDYSDWWLGSCELSGGSSGGPWIPGYAGGSRSIASVNSWGYSNQPGMAGPRLHGNTASCLFTLAKTTTVDRATTC